jgi:hypothetical protein
LLYVLPVSAVMTAVQFFIIRGGMFHLATIVTALSGLVVMFLLYKLRSRKTVFESTAINFPVRADFNFTAVVSSDSRRSAKYCSCISQLPRNCDNTRNAIRSQRGE